MAKIKLAVDQTAQLLRLYLSWPEHVNELGDEEPSKFLAWLENEIDAETLSELAGDIEVVKHFLKSNEEVVHAGRYLKNTEQAGSDNARKEERIPISTQVFVVIYDCDKEPKLEGKAFRGMMMDMGNNGMRLESPIAVPVGTILSMTVAHTGTLVSLYHLTGEVRWLSKAANTNHLGVGIFNFEDYQTWQKDFVSSFSGS